MIQTGPFRPGMRGYLVPLAAGVVLTVSAFLPWVVVGDWRAQPAKASPRYPSVRRTTRGPLAGRGFIYGISSTCAMGARSPRRGWSLMIRV